MKKFGGVFLFCFVFRPDRKADTSYGVILSRSDARGSLDMNFFFNVVVLSVEIEGWREEKNE